MTDSIAQVVADIREILGMLERTGMAKITSSDLSGWADRLDAIASQQGWQTIETAPKDGAAVLIYHPQGGVCEGFCPGDGYGWHCMDGVNTYVGAKSGVSLPRMTTFTTTPTHWRPLPPAPQPTAEGDAT